MNLKNVNVDIANKYLNNANIKLVFGTIKSNNFAIKSYIHLNYKF